MKNTPPLLTALLLASLTALHAEDAPTLNAPQHFGVPKPEHAVSNRAFTGIASLAVAPKGRLWAVWYAGSTPSEDANNYVVLSTSGDNGTTWSEVLTVDPDGIGPVRSFDPELWVSPDGRMFLFWAQRRNSIKPEVWCAETTQPDAAQPKWSKPRRVGEGVMMCKPLVLSSGEWGLPISQWESNGWSIGENSPQLVVSTDAGKTWSLRGSCNVPKDARDADEHMFVERTDGSLRLLVRTRYGIGESVSNDRGKTWPELKPSAIQHPTSRFFIRRLVSGNLLLVKHGPIDTRTSRSHLTAFLSKDDGKTWSGGLLLDERNGVSYPDGDQSSDGLIRIIYDYHRTTDRNILMASFREEDVAAGRDASGMVKLRQLVSRGTGGQEKRKNSTASHDAKPVTNSIGIKLVRIGAGTFTMGQDGPQLEDYLRQKRFGEMHKDIDRIDFDEKPAHQVTISQPFMIGVTEVTVAQYRQFEPDFKTSDPKSKPADDDAASGVTWEKAVAFCEWLSKKEGKTYRLPTEAEWEYACRAGTTTLFHTGDTMPDNHQKWFGEENLRGVYFPPGPMPREYDWRNTGKPEAQLKQGQILGLTHPEAESRAGGTGSLRVAQKTPNVWGLHDMHGNVAEWCSDWYGPYESSSQIDPLGRVDGDCRVFRGGFHSSMIRFLRSANRGSWVTNSASERIGFRVVQGELPKGKHLPVAPPPLNAQNVSQNVPLIPTQPAGAPFFEGPRPFVRIPDDAFGPVFISQNHSPSITECPNGDLLAVWFSTMGETDLTTANAASRLRFGAREWEPASSFWDAMDVNDHAPKIWWDGDLAIFHIVEARQHGDIVIRRSTNNGATWSKAEVMRARGESAGNPIRTTKGVIAIPFDFSGLSISRDNGKTWSETGRDRRGADDIRPGNKGPFIAGIHSPIVELADGRLMAYARLSAEEPAQKRFELKMPVSYSSDLGETWKWEVSEFPIVSNTQRPAMLRLKEGPIVLCSFTDEARKPKNERVGLTFKSGGGDYTGIGLYAAVSYDEGKTWPDRRLIAAEGKTTADINGYVAATQTRDGRIQLITSKDHYVFNLAWIKAAPPAPKK